MAGSQGDEARRTTASGEALGELIVTEADAQSEVEAVKARRQEVLRGFATSFALLDEVERETRGVLRPDDVPSFDLVGSRRAWAALEGRHARVVSGSRLDLASLLEHKTCRSRSRTSRRWADGPCAMGSMGRARSG